MFKINKKLSKQIKDLLSNVRCDSLKISGNNYFVKKDEKLKEYLGYKLAKLAGLICVEYKVININGFFYVISRDINETAIFIPASTVVENQWDLLYIMEDIKKLPYTTHNTIQDLLKMYLFDLIFMNSDRHLYNWGLINIDNEYRILFFDNGDIFSTSFPYIRFNKNNFLDNTKSYSSRICDDLREFLECCPEEYLEELYNLIEKVEPKNVEAIIKDIEAQNNTIINPDFIKTYIPHYSRIKEIMLISKEQRRTR